MIKKILIWLTIPILLLCTYMTDVQTHSQVMIPSMLFGMFFSAILAVLGMIYFLIYSRSTKLTKNIHLKMLDVCNYISAGFVLFLGGTLLMSAYGVHWTHFGLLGDIFMTMMFGLFVVAQVIALFLLVKTFR